MLLVFSACNDGMSRVPPVRKDLMMAEFDDDGKLSVIVVDGGPTLNVVKVKRNSLSGPFVAPVRSIAFWEQNLDLMEAVIYDIANVLVITPRLNDKTDVLKQYPVNFIRGWVSSGYLNLEIGIKSKDIQFHVIGFDEQNTDEPNTVNFVFTHDKTIDIDSATKKIVISIPLNEYNLRFDGSDYTIKLKLNTFDDVQVKQFKVIL